MARDFVREGVQHHQAGRLAEAASCYAKVARSDPGWPHAVHYLGLIALQQGDPAGAARLIKQAIARQPEVPEFHVNLGNAEKRSGNLPAAVFAYDRALALRPSFAEAAANRGLALADLGRSGEAVLAIEHALALSPGLAALRLPLARLYFSLGSHVAAQAHFAAGLDDAAPADAWVEAGISALELRQPKLARQHFQRAIAIDPANYDALNGLGAASADLGLISEAIAALEAARQLAPARLPALENLANVLKDAGRLDEALALYREALALNVPSRFLHSNYLFATLYSDRLSESEIVAAHRTFGDRLGNSPRSAVRLADPARRLRLGYVSGDLFDHPVASFLIGVLRHHAVDDFEVFVYQTGSYVDRTTEQLKSRVEHWREVAQLDDAKLAALVQDDALDVVVDLSGHTADNRLAVFARRLAPVQLSYLGYPFRSGLRAIDYRVVDRVTDPLDAPGDEPLIRLSRTYYGFTPPALAPAVQPLPRLVSGRLTFGVASNLAKVTATTLDDWATLLRTLADTNLRWRAKAFADPGVRQRMFDELGRRGVVPARVQLDGWTASGDRWAALSAVDVALDTRPYNQATSTCEALWMGVPTLTIAGDSHRARMGASILDAVGLPQCIGNSVDDWIRVASSWQEKPQELAGLRAGMRQRMLDSALCDCRGLARELEAAYQRAFAAACGGASPA